MTVASVSGILSDLEDIVSDQLQVVTYKWLGRRFNVPYDTAKRILFQFLTKHGQKVKATFLLSGWAAVEDGGEARHVIRLVEGQQV
jgi:DNA polymerase delta subunit 3